MEHDLLDEIKVFLAHDALLEIIDWTGKETLPQEIAEKIGIFVHEMHAKNKKVRLWGTPNTILGFETLKALKVDVIGTDDLPLLRNFINSSKK